MTVSVDPRRAGPYSGNDATTAFPFAFKVFAKEDIQVVITDAGGTETTATLDSDYSVTLNGDQDASPGGSVTYPISGDELPTGSRLTIIGNLTYEQPTDIPNGNDFNADNIENALDRLLMLVQQVKEIAARALKFKTSDDEASWDDMPLAADRAGGFLAFDAEGRPIAAAATTDTLGTPVTTFAATVLDDASAAAARVTLGLTYGGVFSAYLSGTQSVISSTTPSRINLDSEEFDSEGTFDNATNYRHTPTVAGYYRYSGRVHFVSAASGLCGAALWKNGSSFKLGQYVPLNSGSSMGCVVDALVYMNGTTDYVELRGFQTSGGAINVGATNAFNTYLQGEMVRPA